MNANECMDRLVELREFLEVAAAPEVEQLEALGSDLYAIAGTVAIPCLPAGRYGSGRNQGDTPILDIPICIDGQEVGFLCLTSKLRDSGMSLSAATDAQKYAIVRLASAEAFDSRGADLIHTAMDCIVIDKSNAESILQQRQTSALWGGFIFESDALPLERCVSHADEAKIVVSRLSNPRTVRHRAALQRATESPIAIDRFLHLYHFLELDYDHEIVERIRGIDLENTRGLEKLLGTGRTEFERLLLVSENLAHIEDLERVASSLKDHRETALAIFYEYGKEHNPLKEREAFERQFVDPPAIRREALNEIKRLHALDSNFARDDGTYREMLVKLACYWTYRIRCCIAHNKLGEYHLRTPADMRFVADFGEPLVSALIRHRLGQSPQPLH